MDFDQIFDILTTIASIMLVVAAFGLIILIHEAGHFFAAKWAGIRVLAFALGFGPALVSYRKGLGVRRGSTEAEMHALRADAAGEPGEKRDRARQILARASSTEYRLNALPFGGYVKMLGQDDGDPTAVSDEPDSYQNCPPPKRMVVISAGVVANLITAALMFIVVFRVGLISEPAIVGDVEPGTPAAVTAADNAKALGVDAPGLKPGDKIVAVDGAPPEHFNDVQFHVVYAAPETPVRFTVERPGVKGLLEFSILPIKHPNMGLLAIGIGPMTSDTLETTSSRTGRRQFAENMTALGLDGLRSGMRLVEADGKPAQNVHDVQAAMNASDGRSIPVVFVDQDGERVTVTLRPEPEFQSRVVKLDSKTQIASPHLLGLTPVMAVRSVVAKSNADKAGLKTGDTFLQLGALEYPSVAGGIGEVRRHASEKVRIVVLRPNDAGELQEVDLGEVPVTSEGTIGFGWKNSAMTSNVVAAWPGMSGSGAAPSGASISLRSGSRIVAFNGRPVLSLLELRAALQEAAAALPAGEPLRAKLDVQLPIAGAGRNAVETVDWEIPSTEVTQLKQLGWENPLASFFFDRTTFRWKADSAGEAITMALSETKRNMAMTVLTIQRLFQRTVSPTNLKGPVGIAHVGVSIVDRGFIWLLFYMALISVNLAVINFLPIPITDGGHMLFLIYEQFTGRPPPIVVQNVATIAGLLLIGSLFLYVTFNDLYTAIRAISGFFGG